MCQCNLTPCGGASLSTSICASLNQARVLRGLTGDLTLIKHDPAEPGDYLSLGTVTSCWLIQTTGQGIELRILETTDNTSALLLAMTGVVFGAKVFKISGTDAVQPLGSPAVWSWFLKPSGEAFT